MSNLVALDGTALAETGIAYDPATGVVSFPSFDPVEPNDAAPKSYVDEVAAGLLSTDAGDERYMLVTGGTATGAFAWGEIDPSAGEVSGVRADPAGLHIVQVGSAIDPTQAIYAGYRGNVLTYQVSANGDISNQTGSYGALSDERLKDAITPIDAAAISAGMAQLEIVSYFLKSDPATMQVGMIAQQVEPIFPKAVYQDASGMLGIRYSNFTPLLIAYAQHLESRLEAVEAALAQLGAEASAKKAPKSK